MSLIYLLLGAIPLISSYVLLPSYHQVPLRPLPLLYLLPNPQTTLKPIAISTVDQEQVFSARPNLTGRSNFLSNIPDITRLAATRQGPRNIDLCYFLGQDVFTSHVRCNPNWADGTNEGVKRYINEMTFETNRMVGLDNLRLVWKGPFVRTEGNWETQEEIDAAIRYDVHSVLDEGCDAAVFLLFNYFNEDCTSTTTGHDFGGKSSGGMCEIHQGSGYAEIVDQGFLNDAWVGPQILAHHLLLMLTSDLNDASRTCPNQESLLYPKLDAGNQRVDDCVVDKLNRAGVSNRACMQD